MSRKHTVEMKEPNVEVAINEELIDENETSGVPLKRLCQEAKLDPKAARRVLRKAWRAEDSTIDHEIRRRWSWDEGSDELRQVRVLLGLDKAS